MKSWFKLVLRNIVLHTFALYYIYFDTNGSRNSFEISILILNYTCMTKKQPATNDTAPLTTILKKISKSLELANNGNATSIQLQSVTASFVLSQTSSRGGQLRIWILSIGGAEQRNNIHKVTFELARPKKSSSNGEKGKKDEATDLTQFIMNILTDFHEVNEFLPELSDRGITMEVGLTITKKGNIGGEYEIGIFTLSAEAGKNSEQGHSLKMVLKKV